VNNAATKSLLPIVFLSVVLAGCKTSHRPDRDGRAAAAGGKAPGKTLPAHNEEEILTLIEQLVFDVYVLPGEPTYSPGITKQTEEYAREYESVHEAFKRLTEFGEQAIPYMIDHLDDKRQSINFRNHYLGNTVGDAVYWNIYYQMHDMPEDYSSYGYQRKGSDGEYHVKPYWASTCFRAEGGLEEWMLANAELSYVQKKIKCTGWLLEEEKSIGASGPDSYHENILPLEIRVLELRAEAGESVEDELQKLKKVRDLRRKARVDPDMDIDWETF
jgi:hypothetical protein